MIGGTNTFDISIDDQETSIIYTPAQLIKLVLSKIRIDRSPANEADVAETVRSLIKRQLGVSGFKDTDRFKEDMGLDD